MKVKDRLTAIAVCVDNHPIAVTRETFAAGDLRRGDQKMPKSVLVLRPGLVERFDVLFRDNQNMPRRLRAKIVKSDANVVFVNLIGGNSPFHDLAEDAVLNRHTR